MRRNNYVLEGGEWYVLLGCVLLGLGIGIAVHAAGAGIIIGAGAGFLLMVLAATFLRR